MRPHLASPSCSLWLFDTGGAPPPEPGPGTPFSRPSRTGAGSCLRCCGSRQEPAGPGTGADGASTGGRAPSAGTEAELPPPVPEPSSPCRYRAAPATGSRNKRVPVPRHSRLIREPGALKRGRTGRDKGARGVGGTGATRCPALGDKPREQRVKQRCSCTGLPAPSSSCPG